MEVEMEMEEENVLVGLENKHAVKKLHSRMQVKPSKPSLPPHMRQYAHRAPMRHYSGLDEQERKLMQDAGVSRSELLHVVKATGGALEQLNRF